MPPRRQLEIADAIEDVLLRAFPQFRPWELCIWRSAVTSIVVGRITGRQFLPVAGSHYALFDAEKDSRGELAHVAWDVELARSEGTEPCEFHAWACCPTQGLREGRPAVIDEHCMIVDSSSRYMREASAQLGFEWKREIHPVVWGTANALRRDGYLYRVDQATTEAVWREIARDTGAISRLVNFVMMTLKGVSVFFLPFETPNLDLHATKLLAADES